MTPRIALPLAALCVAPFLTALAPAAAAHAAPVGSCSALQNTLRATGSVSSSGRVLFLSGTRMTPRLQRDTSTRIRVGGVTYRHVGAARAYRTPRRVRVGTLARVHFERTGGLRDYTCSFRVGRR